MWLGKKKSPQSFGSVREEERYLKGPAISSKRVGTLKRIPRERVLLSATIEKVRQNIGEGKGKQNTRHPG